MAIEKVILPFVLMLSWSIFTLRDVPATEPDTKVQCSEQPETACKRSDDQQSAS